MTWSEPTPSLAHALSVMGWTSLVNRKCLRSVHWQVVAAEPSFSGLVHFEPQDSPVPWGAAWTDGSIRSQGGAARVQPASGLRLGCRVEDPRSSTHCELVALHLSRQLRPAPVILSESLVSLRLIAGWHRRSVRDVLECPDRLEVRAFLHQWQDRGPPPILEKVKAHDAQGAAAGKPKAVGNDLADAHAKATAGAVAPSTFRT